MARLLSGLCLFASPGPRRRRRFLRFPTLQQPVQCLTCRPLHLVPEPLIARVYVFHLLAERSCTGEPRLEGPVNGLLILAANFGPLVSLEHRNKVKYYYDLAVEEGATVEIGGGIPDMGEEMNGGAWIEPTIWTGLSDDARVIREEIFGPCCHIRPFDTEEETIQLANDTEYGLAAAIWTENSSRAIRVAEQIEAGLVWVNSWFLRDLRTAFGGAKQSGIGREGGVHGLEFYTELKNICIKL